MVKRIATLNNCNKGILKYEQFNFKLIFVICNELPNIVPANRIEYLMYLWFIFN